MICKILGLFVNILTADDKYSRLNRNNLMQSVQIQLSTKQKIFSELFSGFFKSSLNFEHFEITGDHHSLSISEITDCERHR